jgi:hypothetical protein
MRQFSYLTGTRDLYTIVKLIFTVIYPFYIMLSYIVLPQG